MKHYLLFLLSLCASGALLAQNPFCDVFVWPTGYTNGVTTLTAFDSSSAQPVSYTWSTGAGTPEIEVGSDGVYCVTVTYADGCTASDCDTVDSDMCFSGAYSWNGSNGTYTLAAFHYPGYLDAEYQWSDGQTGQQIQITQSGTYTVLVTLENGCTSTASVTAAPPQCDLYVFQLDSIETGSIWLYASMWPNGVVSYLWNTGDSTNYLEITQPGTYCVTATNAFGCSQTECVTINCGIDIEQNPAGQFTATSLLGVAPYTYSWSDSSTTQTITPSASGYYCVTVTDGQGCSSDDCMYFQGCTATITYNSDHTLTANMNGDGPFAYEWTPGGFTTQTITPTESGNYYVQIINANGCTDWAYQYWYGPDGCNPTLGVTTVSDSFPLGNSTWIGVHPEGNWSDWAYEWNTGNTERQIVVTAGGEYCVTVTNTVVAGCTAVKCTWVQPDSACYVQISSTQLNPATVQLSVAGGPDPLATYAWSTGDNTPTTDVTVSGQYGVTVTNTAGCTVSGYYWIYPPDYSYVRVYLSDSTGIGNNGVHADIYLIEYDPAQGGMLTAIDTVATDTWTNSWALVSMQDVPPGEYLIKAALKPNSNGYDNHLPTYFENALLWSDATPVTINAIHGSFSTNSIHINLFTGQNPGGPGFIGGLVSQGANLTGGGDEAESLGEGDPFQGASVVLTLPDGTPVATAVTGAGGQYSFENLAWGTYTLTLDIPGLAPVSITVTIGPGQPSVTSANFKVDENSIALPVQEIVAGKQVKVFPNPAHDVLTVELPAAAELTLTNMQGQVAQRTLENGAVARLSLRDLSAGIYFLTARMANSIQVLKVMIE